MEKNMKTFEFIAPCHFGLEAVLKREIMNLGYDIVEVEDGKVAWYALYNRNWLVETNPHLP